MLYLGNVNFIIWQ